VDGPGERFCCETLDGQDAVHIVHSARLRQWRPGLQCCENSPNFVSITWGIVGGVEEQVSPFPHGLLVQVRCVPPIDQPDRAMEQDVSSRAYSLTYPSHCISTNGKVIPGEGVLRVTTSQIRL